VIRRKAIYLDPYSDGPRKRRKLDGDPTADNHGAAASPASAADAATAAAVSEQQTAPEAAADPADAAGDGAAGSPSSSSCPESPRGHLEGVVLEVKRVAQRDQVYVYEGDADYANFLQSLHCMVCGGDENEEHLLICDGEAPSLILGCRK